MKGWKYESYRHSLAAKGIKTSFYDKNKSNWSPGFKAEMEAVDAEYELEKIQKRIDEIENHVINHQESPGEMSELQRLYHEKDKLIDKLKIDNEEGYESFAAKKITASNPGLLDDFNDFIGDEFIDGKTKMGPWAKMTPESFAIHGVGLGIGKGQRYKKMGDEWVQVEGGSAGKLDLGAKSPFARKDYDDKLRDIATSMGRSNIPEIGKIETAFENVGSNHVREVQYIYDVDGDIIDERVVDIYKKGINDKLHSLVDKGKVIDLAAKKKIARWQK